MSSLSVSPASSPKLAQSPSRSPTSAISDLFLSPTKKVVVKILHLVKDSKRSDSFTNSLQAEEIDEINQKLLFLASHRQAKVVTKADQLLMSERKLFKKIRQVVAASNFEPRPTGNDTNGSYFLHFDQDTVAGVYKPRLQARGCVDSVEQTVLRQAIPKGQECVREKLADILNFTLGQDLHSKISSLADFGVPPTDIETYQHPLFGEHHCVGSFQQFVPNCTPLEAFNKENIDAISIDEFMKLALFDLITLNNDRHLGNVLVDNASKRLILIDHGACFPEVKGVKEVSFDWMHLPFTKQPFSPQFCAFIRSINTKATVNSLATSCDILKDQFAKQNLELSANALFVAMHAIILLKAMVALRPELSINDFCRGYCKESLPVVEVRTGTKLLKFAQDPTFNLKSFNPSMFCKEHHLDLDSSDCSVSRKSIGGQFATLIMQNYTSLNIASMSVNTLLTRFDEIEQKVRASITDRLFLTAAELC